MFTVRLDDIISQVVDATIDHTYSERVLPGVIRKKGIVFKNIMLTVEDPKTERNRLSTECMLICCGNTSVFAVINDGKYKHFHLPAILNADWINLSNHDSCWRDSIQSFITDIYFKLCRRINDNVAPVTLESRACLGFSKIFELIDVDVITDTVREPENNYWKKIVNIERKK